MPPYYLTRRLCITTQTTSIAGTHTSTSLHSYPVWIGTRSCERRRDCLDSLETLCLEQLATKQARTPDGNDHCNTTNYDLHGVAEHWSLKRGAIRGRRLFDVVMRGAKTKLASPGTFRSAKTRSATSERLRCRNFMVKCSGVHPSPSTFLRTDQR